MLTIYLQPCLTPRRSDFTELLKDLRFGRVHQQTLEILQQLQSPLDALFLPNCRPVELYATRHLVSITNDRHLKALPGPLFEYMAVDGPQHPESLPYYADMPIDRVLQLRVGAQVMLRKNLGHGLYNGSIGTVLFCLTTQDMVRYGSSECEFGDGCVRHIDGSLLPHLHTSTSSPEAYPVVRFDTATGIEIVYCRPEVFQIEDSRGQIVATRTQVCWYCIDICMRLTLWYRFRSFFHGRSPFTSHKARQYQRWSSILVEYLLLVFIPCYCRRCCSDFRPRTSLCCSIQGGILARFADHKF